MNNRNYRMSKRADATLATGEAILDAMLSCFADTPYDRIRLDEVARRAGVTSQTVIRRFGGKDALMVTMSVRELEAMRSRRGAATPGAVTESIHALTAFYEHYAVIITKLYAEAEQVTGLGPVVAAGRAFHLDWCAAAFGPLLDDLEPPERRRRFAQVVAACDVRFWDVLVTDGALDQRDAAAALDEALHALLRS